MKRLLIFWAAPILFLGVWYYLSLNDMSFGIFMLTRKAHDLVFAVYGNALGIAPDAIPPLVMRAIVVDSVLLFAIVGFRRRRKISAWYQSRRSRSAAARPDNLSSAP
jgi:hypothetical protein